ncbi:MAG: hypothetical protein GEV09_20260 [Pseudonocardiaceae bacterium]|nr:hypothetical protein [Pseudonocardiaceae bacterium]
MQPIGPGVTRALHGLPHRRDGARDGDPVNPGERETYRAAIETRRPADCGGGTCTLLVRRVDGRVQLLHHGVLSTGAELSDDQARELVGYLTAATQPRSEQQQ